MAATIDGKEYISPREAALAAGVTQQTIRRWLRSGLLSAHKTASNRWFIAKEGLAAFLSQPAWTQYMGISGSTYECVDAVAQLVQTGPQIQAARIITAPHGKEAEHALLLTVGPGDSIVIPSGFASGYGGTGPHGFSFVLALLKSVQVEIDEVEVETETLRRIDSRRLTEDEFEEILQCRPVSPVRWHDYVYERDLSRISDGTLWGDLDPFLPLAVVDPRIADLAMIFRDDPDKCLTTAFRRLEDEVRSRTGTKESATKLLARAFNGSDSILTWNLDDEGEHQGRANMFTGIFMAFRNRRGHSEEQQFDRVELLKEFLMVNTLFSLLRTAVARE